MHRRAFLMSLEPGAVRECALRHELVWAELVAALREHGVTTYGLFHEPTTNQLFGYVAIEEEARWKDVVAAPVYQRWGRFLGDLVPANADGPSASGHLREVFRLR